ncbi:MAG TPA: hypothetical protein VM120_11045 [Bryobacteraceae bacterium]|nr:hypothetical protein [Bryobacteraceae bacterium]
MSETTYRNRRAWSLENDLLRVTVLFEGGHLAELTHKASGMNPLWTPPWPSIEPSRFDRPVHGGAYGAHDESRLLAGIMGHNLCMDIFGGMSPEEAAAGLTPHGEGSIVPYAISESDGVLTSRATFPLSQIAFERQIRLKGTVAVITESARNLTSIDKPTAWTQHVTLGPPFLEKGKTLFRAPATRSRVFETDFGAELGRYLPGADFDWPRVPLKHGGSLDLRVMPDAPASSGFTTHLMDPHREQAFFAAWNPGAKLLCGYVWRRTDFPWLGIWEENHSRPQPPWNSKTLTRGMEFGASPMPETRRKMIERGSLFGVPGYRWIPAKTQHTVEYCAFVMKADAIPDEVEWDGGGNISLR